MPIRNRIKKRAIVLYISYESFAPIAGCLVANQITQAKQTPCAAPRISCACHDRCMPLASHRGSGIHPGDREELQGAPDKPACLAQKRIRAALGSQQFAEGVAGWVLGSGTTLEKDGAARDCFATPVQSPRDRHSGSSY